MTNQKQFPLWTIISIIFNQNFASEQEIDELLGYLLGRPVSEDDRYQDSHDCQKYLENEFHRLAAPETYAFAAYLNRLENPDYEDIQHHTKEFSRRHNIDLMQPVKAMPVSPHPKEEETHE